MKIDGYEVDSYEIVLSKFSKLKVNRPSGFIGSSEE